MLNGEIDFVPNPVKFNELIHMFNQLGIFSSINHSRILAYLLASSKGSSAKDICSDLGLPNSKVYSALNSLVKLGLVSVSNGRPKIYQVSSTRAIEQFLDEFLHQEMRKKKSMVEEIHALIDQIWSPEIPSLDQIAYIYKGRDLHRQISRMISSAQEKIFILLGDQSSKIIDVCLKSLERANKNLVVDAAFPSITSEIEGVLKRFEKMRSKQSIWKGNSYLVIDGRLMLSITHPHDVGLLTNDALLVDHICNCWADPKCCQ